jgi:hypothetical protein
LRSCDPHEIGICTTLLELGKKTQEVFLTGFLPFHCLTNIACSFFDIFLKLATKPNARNCCTLHSKSRYRNCRLLQICNSF